MNKDAVLATLIGFAIGLTITGIIIVAPSVAKNAPKFPVPAFPKLSLPSLPKLGSKSPAPQPTPGKSSVKGAETTGVLAIDAPIPETVESADVTTVTGKAPAQSRILVQTPVEDVVSETSDNGTFTVKAGLKEGKNDITVTASNPAGVIKTVTVTVYYTPETL
jgi:hypothetical protein